MAKRELDPFEAMYEWATGKIFDGPAEAAKETEETVKEVVKETKKGKSKTDGTATKNVESGGSGESGGNGNTQRVEHIFRHLFEPIGGKSTKSGNDGAEPTSDPKKGKTPGEQEPTEE